MKRILIMFITIAIIIGFAKIHVSAQEYSLFPEFAIEHIKGYYNFKGELVKHINVAKIAQTDDINYSLYTRNKVSEIEYFYFPNIKIDGYKLFRVGVLAGDISYCWDSDEEIERREENSSFSSVRGIMMAIARPSSVTDPSNPLKDIIEQAERNGYGYLTEDNFIYDKQRRCIDAQIGNTFFSLYVPHKLNNYETLRDLCFEIIETSELVVVEEYNFKYAPGCVLGEEEPTIFDALELLKYLVNMDNTIVYDEAAREAAIITDESKVTGEPTIFDALEILKYLVGMPGVLLGDDSPDVPVES